jgi:hypothetical protein
MHESIFVGQKHDSAGIVVYHNCALVPSSFAPTTKEKDQDKDKDDDKNQG